MLGSGQTYNTNAFFNNKLKAAEEKKTALLDTFNRLSRFSYDKGTREGDFLLRERVKQVVAEVDLQYQKIRTLSSYKGGDEDIFYDILDFFNSRYFENNLLEGYLDLLDQLISQQEKFDQDKPKKPPEAKDHPDRKNNALMRGLDADLRDWEKILHYNAVPQLFDFLSDLNEIILFSRINENIARLFLIDDVFARSGGAYEEFKNDFCFFIIMHMKLSAITLSEKEMIDLINRMLKQMGFRDILIRARNINEDTLYGMYEEIIKSGHLAERAKTLKITKKLAIEKLREKSESLEQYKSVPRDIAALVEDLCYLEEISDKMNPEPGGLITGLAKKDRERYLFHVPGTFDISLKFISEYLRNSLVFVMDWLQKEIQKNPDLTNPFQAFIECIPTVKEFVSVYRMALEAASIKSNQSTTITGKEKYFISKNIARRLAEIIEKNCKNIKLALIDVSYKMMNSTLDKSGMLEKKINIMKDAYNDSHQKIMKGLRDIEKI